MKNPLTLKVFFSVLCFFMCLASQSTAQETFRCLEKIRENKGLNPEEKKGFLMWMDMAGYPAREKNVRKLHPILEKFPGFSIELIKCYLNTRYGGGLDEQKYGILDDLPDDLKTDLIEYAVSLYKDKLNTELSRFVDCWGKLLFELNKSGFKTEILMDSTRLNGYNELLLKNAILSNYGVKIDTAMQLSKTRTAYEREFKNQESWYNPAQDTDAIILFYQRAGQNRKFTESEIPFIVP